MQVDIIDFGMGNVRSVGNLLHRLNVSARLVHAPSDLKSTTLIIPGVGCAGPYFRELHRLGFDDAIVNAIQKGKKVIGICLGFQILTRSSEESGGVKGLGVFNAETRRLHDHMTHNGWESFHLDRRQAFQHNALQKPKLTKKHIVTGRMYYNHEYGVVSDDEQALNYSISESLQNYSAMMVKENIVGIQFHPEKSQASGLELFKHVL